jgi:hypothetical protein
VALNGRTNLLTTESMFAVGAAGVIGEHGRESTHYAEHPKDVYFHLGSERGFEAFGEHEAREHNSGVVDREVHVGARAGGYIHLDVQVTSRLICRLFRGRDSRPSQEQWSSRVHDSLWRERDVGISST